MIAERFRAAGISAEHCDADTPEREREALLKRHELGEIKIICNVGIYGTGVDLPYLKTLIMGRPTQSYNLFIQQAGRLTRTFDGKDYGILLDHAGNINKHGFPTDEPEVDLDGKIKAESHKSEMKICDECFGVYIGASCDLCGAVKPVRKKAELTETDHELQEIKENPVRVLHSDWLKHFEQQRIATGRKQGWQFYKLIDKFGLEAVQNLLPAFFLKRLEMKKSGEIPNVFASAPFSKKQGQPF